jgi:hypothetical protein
MKLIYIGSFVSQKESISDPRISQAGTNYQLKLIEQLNPEVAFSLAPIFSRKKDWNYDEYSNVKSINNQSTLPGKLNYLYRFVFDTIHLLLGIKRAKIKDVFFYNIDRQNIASIILSKFLLRKKVFIIVADYSNYDNKGLFDKCSNWLVKRVNGAIVFNSNIKVNKNQQTLPGLLDENRIVHAPETEINNNVLLSGSLGKTTGLEIALEAFSKKHNFNLFITGRPYGYSGDEFNVLIDKYSSKHTNIQYLGLLDYEEYLAIVDKCSLALSLRNPKDVEHQFNFPSKILEYLSRSKFVISSIKYEDMPDDFMFHTNFDADSLGETLDAVQTREISYRNELKMKISDYLKLNFTVARMKKICNELTSFKG